MVILALLTLRFPACFLPSTRFSPCLTPFRPSIAGISDSDEKAPGNLPKIGASVTQSPQHKDAFWHPGGTPGAKSLVCQLFCLQGLYSVTSFPGPRPQISLPPLLVAWCRRTVVTECARYEPDFLAGKSSVSFSQRIAHPCSFFFPVLRRRKSNCRARQAYFPPSVPNKCETPGSFLILSGVFSWFCSYALKRPCYWLFSWGWAARSYP